MKLEKQAGVRSLGPADHVKDFGLYSESSDKSSKGVIQYVFLKTQSLNIDKWLKRNKKIFVKAS